MRTEHDIIELCLALIDRRDDLSAAEQELAATSSRVAPAASTVDAARRAIARGADPLGDSFSSIRSARARRATGAVYTPPVVVGSMLAWLARQGRPERIVDPGAGSGRFLLAAGAAFPDARLVAVELDPLAALMLRANLSALGWTRRATVLVADYRDVSLPGCAGMTAFVGNPPYVRHHEIADDRKSWYAARFADLGVKASMLAGLHLHFFLKTRLLARTGDIGAFVTAAEWLDVNYGSALRRLLVDDLGGVALHVLEPAAEAFPGTATTAAIACFLVGRTSGPIRVRSVKKLTRRDRLLRGTDVPRQRLRTATRWSVIVRPSRSAQSGEIELGELFRVHRGQVTGANDVWIAGARSVHLPDRVKQPAVTRATDLIRAGSRLEDANALRRVVDLPSDLDHTDFSLEERRRINAFLTWARAHGADRSYVARHRRAWWSVGLREPAPILCTYMARRPPQFTRNACRARHINIAHGLYPRQPLADRVLDSLVSWLNAHVDKTAGRTYAGGLTKFEPREIERLRVPRPMA